MSADREDLWIAKRVPEAATDEHRQALYSIGRHLRMMLEFAAANPAPKIRPGQRNKASEAVVKAWDRLMLALEDHPTFEKFEHPIACERHGVDMREAAKYADALRSIIGEYRNPTPDKGGQPRLRRAEALREAAGMVQELLPVSEHRAVEIVADIATELLADEVSADSIRVTKGRDRRERT